MIVAGIVALVLGLAVGYNTAPEEKKHVSSERPDKWQPEDHSEMLRTCGIVCGENSVKSYSSLFGKCECKGDK